MNLVYDLRYATDHFPGIGTYARALAAAVLGREGIESVTLLWDPRARNTRFDLEPLRRHARARWLDVDVAAMAPNTARETGRILSRLDADAYLSPFWIKPEGTDVPCVVTVHDVLPLAQPRVMSWPRRLAFSWAMRRAATAAAVLTVSRFSRDEILRLTPIPADRIHVVASGVPVGWVAPQRPAGVPDGPFALTVGANRPHKGLDTVAAVWRAYGARYPMAWVAAGANVSGRYSIGPLVDGVTGAHVLGQVSPAELEWLYRNATLVLVPSRYEGFGLATLEAAARGAAVVASDITALHETSEGIVRFEPADDVAAWARAIDELTADEAARRRLAAAGPARAAQYDFSGHGEILETLLNDVLAGAGA